MTLPERIFAARRDFVARYALTPNVLLLGVEHDPEDARKAADVLGLRIFTTPDLQDFIVCLIHDHTV